MPPSEIDCLRAKLDELGLRGKKVVPFKGLPVMDKAFFPGGNGLFGGKEASIPTGGVIILGSNFGCVSDFVHEDGSLVRSDETESSRTWSGLKQRLGSQSGISLDQCFFTNAWPFLHEGKSNMTRGLIPAWLTDRSLMKKCTFLFAEALSIIRPKLIVALGTGAPAFLSNFWPDELAVWAGNSIASIDEMPIAATRFSGVDIICTAITHPSHSNSWRRRPPYRQLNGEIRLLSDATIRCQLDARSWRTA